MFQYLIALVELLQVLSKVNESFTTVWGLLSKPGDLLSACLAQTSAKRVNYVRNMAKRRNFLARDGSQAVRKN